MMYRFGMMRLLVVVAASLLMTARAATYHVAEENVSARDESPGDFEHPLKTISKAAELLKAGDLVIIHSGVYRERVLIKASGTAQQPIRIEAAEGNMSC